MSPPVAILSFNRPHYLRRVLNALAAQLGTRMNDRRIYLFQDGALNLFSGARYCEKSTISSCVSYFKSSFPRGEVFVSDSNLGVALNFDRAERFLFEEQREPVALFFEDDLVILPTYVGILDSLLEMALKDESIGYVAAYGNHRAPLADQLRRAGEFVRMQHFWGFGVTRRQWIRERPFRESYLDIVREQDYRQRDHRKIDQLFRSWGLGVPGTSRDVARGHAAILTDAARINTFACFAQYIGARGVHFTPSLYEKLLFHTTSVMRGDPPVFQPPTHDQLTRFLYDARSDATRDHWALSKLMWHTGA